MTAASIYDGPPTLAAWNAKCAKCLKIRRWSRRTAPAAVVRGWPSSRPRQPWTTRTTAKTWRPTFDRSPLELRHRHFHRGNCAAAATTSSYWSALVAGRVPRSLGANIGTGGGPTAPGQVCRPTLCGGTWSGTASAAATFSGGGERWRWWRYCRQFLPLHIFLFASRRAGKNGVSTVYTHIVVSLTLFTRVVLRRTQHSGALTDFRYARVNRRHFLSKLYNFFQKHFLGNGRHDRWPPSREFQLYSYSFSS